MVHSDSRGRGEDFSFSFSAFSICSRDRSYALLPPFFSFFTNRLLPLLFLCISRPSSPLLTSQPLHQNKAVNRYLSVSLHSLLPFFVLSVSRSGLSLSSWVSRFSPFCCRHSFHLCFFFSMRRFQWQIQTRY